MKEEKVLCLSKTCLRRFATTNPLFTRETCHMSAAVPDVGAGRPLPRLRPGRTLVFTFMPNFDERVLGRGIGRDVYERGSMVRFGNDIVRWVSFVMVPAFLLARHILE